ncbi:MAG: T9SS type A sorting domain-containing protein [Bacteroidales bacterium]|nr:T9SS type A sorting domain-containing protein [Bacteroidales bacterium]MCF8405430.1 T9SS type A sorting domain-containing protein [Bacteroidales bacterium]
MKTLKHTFGNRLKFQIAGKSFLRKINLLIFSTIFTCMFISFTHAQDNPFHLTQPTKIESNDIMLFWMEDIGGANIKSYQKVYRYKTEGILLPPDSIEIDTMINETLRREDNRPGSNKYVDIATGRFNIDPYDDAVAVWRNNQSNQKIEIMISHFDTSGFFSNTTAFTLDAGEELEQDQQIFVRTGNFDSDTEDEFIVVCRDISDSVLFYVYDVDSMLQIQLIKRYSDNKVNSTSLTTFVRYFAETADLNGDGIDELITTTYELPFTDDYVPITIRIYAFENGDIIPKGTKVIQTPKYSHNMTDFAMSLAAGQFDSDAGLELAFGSVVKSPNFDHKVHNYILDITADLQSISLGNIWTYTPIWNNTSVNYHTEFCMTCGDLNNNGRDEVVFAIGNKIKVSAVNDDLSFSGKVLIHMTNGMYFDYLQSYNYLKISDMNMDNKKDIIVVKNIVGWSSIGFITKIHSLDTTLDNATLIAQKVSDESQHDNYQPFAIAVGNFDGFDYTLGLPTLYHAYDIVQPVVILNAPPVHFDMIDGTIYDVNACYNGGDCDFFSQYLLGTGTSMEVSTQTHSDWSVSTGVKTEGSVTVEPMGVGISYNYKLWAIGSYGEHFSNENTYGQSIYSEVTVDARDDDRIFATTFDYDIWEYPIFHRNETFPRRSYLALVPKNAQGTWFGSKSYFASNYIPEHEVGNIMSYSPDTSFTINPDLSEVIEANYGGSKFSVDVSSNYNWDLVFQDFQNNQASTEWDIGVDVGIETGNFTFTYGQNLGNMTTQKTSVQNELNLHVHLGSLNPASSDAKYSGAPYAYWANNGALVVDYAVEPELSQPGFPQTWWQDTYGNNPDPTFILPWRLDPEKGYSLSDPSKRYLTKDIIISPANPQEGDTSTIIARVRNYSFVATSSTVTVSFYLGDPDSTGTPIMGIDGTNSASISEPIIARGRSDATFKWVIPAGLPSYPRIYAEIDEQNMINEIHEDNNKGFTVLGLQGIIPNAVEEYGVNNTGEYVLKPTYPNPFRTYTNIEYTIPKSERATIKVFDYLGREIATLIDKYVPAGTYFVTFDGQHLAAGIYYCTLQAGNYRESRKMILLK